MKAHRLQTEINLTAALLGLRGTIGTFFTLLNASKGTEAHFIEVFFPVLIVGGVLTFIARGIIRRQQWAWAAGTGAVVIYIASDIILTALGSPQHTVEFVIDFYLISYLYYRRDIFRMENNPDVSGTDEDSMPF